MRSSDANELEIGLELVQVEVDDQWGCHMAADIPGVCIDDLDTAQLGAEARAIVLRDVNVDNASRPFEACFCESPG